MAATSIALGWGPGAWQTYCDPAAGGAPTVGWGGGRQWRMHTNPLETGPLQGWGGGAQYKLVCEGEG